MSDRIKILTPTERALQQVLTRIRYSSGRTVILDGSQLDNLFDATMRGGPVYSLFSQFDTSMQVEWAMRVLSYLTEQRITYDNMKVRNFGWRENWAAAKAEIERLFTEQWDADVAEQQDEYDWYVEEGETYSGTAVVVDGKVVDPWGFPEARWFLDHMTQYTVFTVWQVVSDAVNETMRDYLGCWAEGDNENDPREVANEAFEKVMANLREYINEVFEAEAQRAAPVEDVADLLTEKGSQGQCNNQRGISVLTIFLDFDGVINQGWGGVAPNRSLKPAKTCRYQF